MRLWPFSVSLYLLLPFGAIAAVPKVNKVEPPNWWPAHTLNPIRLLIHGSGLQKATVGAPKGLIATNAWANETGTYLLVSISIERGLPPGNYPLQINSNDGATIAPFRLEAPLSATGRFQGFSPEDVIYLIMPDRFANGDPSNDDPAISRGLFDRKNSHFYHGGDLAGIIERLSYLKTLGITTVWLTPVYDNTNVPNQRQAVEGRAIADYHGYGAVDYYAVDEHLGDLTLLRRLIDEAHAMGLKVIQDQVANHVGPDHPWVIDPPKPNWFHGTRAHHIKETWQIWSLPDPHASSELKRSVLDGWFADALPDLNQEDADVAQYEIQNALWWMGEAGFDGIRQDTLPYVPRDFWHAWSAALKRQYPNFRAVGEVFDPDPAVPSFFQGGATRFDGVESGIGSVFDFPSYFKMREVFAKGGEIERLSRTLAQDPLYPDPAGLVTFFGNHDIPRFMSESGATPERLKLAFTLLLTMRGIPCIYYGDEIGMQGGNDPDNRRDFPGGWKEDSRNAFEAAGRTSEENQIFDYVRKLTAVRAKSEALRKGKMIDLAVTTRTWAFARQSGEEAAVVVINNGAEAADIQVPFSVDGTFAAKLRSGELVVQNGRGSVHMPAYSAEIYLR
ncbi:MAG: cyclomaltodextrinase N-terminal domain-containing protein [Acidobacteriaceae bacterium]|nr:cyclomaltodextrinase N-terminal domain-containing protein [Acidobacteriaceae bacterium]